MSCGRLFCRAAGAVHIECALFHSRCVQMLEWFDYGGHICISFEILGLSVFDFMVSRSALSSASR